MKYTDIEIKDLMYKLIKASDIPKKVTGKVYKVPRPVNSQLEDVVISIVARSASEIQSFSVNVNLYVPDIKREDDYIENTVRLRELSRLCFDFFETIVKDNYILNLDGQECMKVNDVNFHCISNKLKLRIINE